MKVYHWLEAIQTLLIVQDDLALASPITDDKQFIIGRITIVKNH